MVKIRVLPRNLFTKRLFDVGADIKGDQAGRQTDGDLLKISMLRCDGLKSHGDPSDV